MVMLCVINMECLILEGPKFKTERGKKAKKTGIEVGTPDFHHLTIPVPAIVRSGANVDLQEIGLSLISFLTLLPFYP